MVAANPYLRAYRITPHSFRISAADWLLRQSRISRDRIAVLGRWHSGKSLETYIRENSDVPAFASLDRSAMP